MSRDVFEVAGVGESVTGVSFSLNILCICNKVRLLSLAQATRLLQRSGDEVI
jgi:hypothetical protein